MRTARFATALGLAVSLALVACGGAVPGGSPPSPGQAGGAAGGSAEEAAFVRLEVRPENARIELDEALLLSVVGVRQDGSRVELREEALFEVDPPGALLEAGGGLFFGQAAGPASIRIAARGLGSEAGVLVEATAARLAGLEVTPISLRGAPGQRFQLQLSGRWTDGTSRDLGSGASGTRYASSDPAIAAVGADGGVELLQAGEARLTITHAAFSAGVQVEVVELRVVAFALIPDYEVLGLGDEARLAAVGTLEDGSAVDLSCASAYESSDVTVVEVLGCGVLTGVTPGDELVRAVSPDGSLEAAARVSVRQRELQSIDVICPESIPVGESRAIEVWARFRGSSDEELSFDPAAVTFVNRTPGLLGGEGPSFTGVAAGRAFVGVEVVRYAHSSSGCGIEVLPAPVDLRVLAGETADLPLGVPEFDSIVVEAGGRLLVTHGNEVVARRVVIEGTLEVSGKPGVAGLAVAAPGGAGGPRGGGGGGGADGDTLRPAEGGAGIPAGSAAASASGAGTAAGDGGGAEGGSGAAGGCARGGGGGGLRGAGGRGGGEAGFATGAAGGPANVAGWGSDAGTGGGGGSTCGNNSGGGGGGGGGMLVIRAEEIEIRGQVRADGGLGGAGFTGSGGGGGGSGGTIALLASTSLLLTGRLSARGAAGGDAPDGAAGGGGGGGQILLVGPAGVDVSAAVLDVSGGDGGSSPVGAGEAGGGGVIDLT